MNNNIKQLEDAREMILHIRGELYKVKELLDEQIKRQNNENKKQQPNT